MNACPVCGAAHVSCVGSAPFDPAKVIDPLPRNRSTTVANDTTVFLPKQQVRRGTAGYKATHGDKVVVVADDGSRRTAQEDAANDRKASRPKSAKAQEPASEKGAQG